MSEPNTELAKKMASWENNAKKLADKYPAYAAKIMRVGKECTKVKEAALNPKEEPAVEVTMYESDGRIFVTHPQLYRGANYYHKKRLSDIEGHRYDGKEHLPARNASAEEKKEAFANPLARLRSFPAAAKEAVIKAMGTSFPGAPVVDKDGKPTGENLPVIDWQKESEAAG